MLDSYELRRRHVPSDPFDSMQSEEDRDTEPEEEKVQPTDQKAEVPAPKLPCDGEASWVGLEGHRVLQEDARKFLKPMGEDGGLLGEEAKQLPKNAGGHSGRGCVAETSEVSIEEEGLLRLEK